MPDILDTVDHLRGRLVRLKRGHTLSELASAIGIHVGTLRTFLAGGNSTIETIQAIEAWCNRQEAPHADV